MNLVLKTVAMISLSLGIMQPNVQHLETLQPMNVVDSDVHVTKENFPDANFRSYVESKEIASDGIITKEELATNNPFKDLDIDCDEYDIRDFKGIELLETKSLTLGHFKGSNLVIPEGSKLNALEVYETDDLKTVNLDALDFMYYLTLSVVPNVTSVDVSHMREIGELNLWAMDSLSSLILHEESEIDVFSLSSLPKLTSINGAVKVTGSIDIESVPITDEYFDLSDVHTVGILNTLFSNPYFLADSNYDYLSVILGGNQFPFLEIGGDPVQYRFYDRSTKADFAIKSNVIDLIADETDDGYVVTIDGINMNKVELHEDCNWEVLDKHSFILRAAELEALNYYYRVDEIKVRPQRLFSPDGYVVGDDAKREEYMFIVSKVSIKQPPIVDPVDPIDPVDPVDPIDPIDPVKPVDPVKPTPTEPVNDPSKGLSSKPSVATGDVYTTNTLLYTLLISGVAIGAIAIKKKKEN
ncbi:hypothetical protein EDD63_14610 [Breznakia blatticola]|uniref:Uncharacterized protein n=1 Tax=Breznakia blatticola TaxID=1754012 RepID=A0A4R7ZAR5_9FIRM|nr:hypothetical protein [Breznakia blatticola]TDW13169.1 hypothetical protein EDD63_14610 [Breznakia blatticola]